MLADNEDKVLRDLEAFGLTTLEAKAYVTLLSFREATATALARVMGLHAAQLYGILEKLVQKGFVVEQPGRPKVYKAVEPEKALERVLRDLRERRDRLVRVLSRVVAHPFKPAAPPIWLVRGHRNIAEVIQDMIGSARHEILLSVSCPIFPSIVESLRIARARGVSTFILLLQPHKPESAIEEASRVGRVRLGRKGDLVLIVDMAKCLYIQHALLSSLGLESYALLINELSLVDLFMHNFVRQWLIARPFNDYPSIGAPQVYTCHRLALLDIKHLLEDGYEVYAEVDGYEIKEGRSCKLRGRVRDVTMDAEEGVYNFLLEVDDGRTLRVGGFDAYLEDVAARTIKVWTKP